MKLLHEKESGDLIIRIEEEEHGMMIKDIIKKQTGMSRYVLREILANGGVTRNDNFCYLTNRVETGDVIRISFPCDEQLKIEPEQLPVHIVYEDPHLVVIDKTPGIVVHPTKNYPNGTLANGLAFHYLTMGLHYKIRPVHRLDRDTSGVIVFAKTHFAHQKLSKEIKQHKVERLYFAVVYGKVEHMQATVDVPIGRDLTHTTKRMVDLVCGKRSITHYHVRQTYGNLASAVELRLETGRTHQIRVHMASIGHPLIGDPLYGDQASLAQSAQLGVERQALHAATLIFKHPVTQQTMSFVSPTPDDLQRLLHTLEKIHSN